MFARIILILLFPIAWPVYFVIWCHKHPEEVRHSITSVRDLIRRHPKRTAWLGVVFGGIGVIGHVVDGEFLAMTVGVAVVGWCGWLLLKWNRQEAGAAGRAAEQAKRVGDAAAAEDDGEADAGGGTAVPDRDVTGQVLPPIGEAAAPGDRTVRGGGAAAERSSRASSGGGDRPTGQGGTGAGEARHGGAATARVGVLPARASRAEGELFVYGTLQFPEVLVELIGRSPAAEPAEIPGWRVAALPGRVYPGLVPDPEAVARGVILSGLDAGEWEVLDAFEDDEYELRSVRSGSGQTLAYVWTADVTAQDWQATEFAATHLAAFVTRCGQWRTAS
ncbi:gamma-glutamylcyclotransferase family protein [Nocardia aurea]|uniref:gamma-glutamylcyclotransferase family protein n=1 Tax=Nocardia aurea TaxID=2144174 RepID=UPI0033A3220E